MKLINDYNAFENKYENYFTECIDYDPPYGDFKYYYTEITFDSYEECDEEEKKIIDEKKKADKKKCEEILSDHTRKYDKKGKIVIPLYKKITYGPESFEEVDKIEIEITQRQLAEYGIVPEDINWKTMREANKEKKEAKRGKVSSKDIASASKNLPSKNVKGIGWVIKSLIIDLFNSKE